MGVVGDETLLEDSFEVMIPIAYNASAVTVHGITRDESRDGLLEPRALRLFLDYLRDGVVVGYHIDHDIARIN